MTNNNLESLDRLVDIAMELVQVHTEASHIEHEVASLKRQLSIEEVPRTYTKGSLPHHLTFKRRLIDKAGAISRTP